jgi:diaminohydroxyphosphoribosylaminopyrimidine deaminase/5-amino-6-(5-phosphoribosylamino)uracil reductase
MHAAIAQGEQGRMSAPPNPWVGCVLVKEGEIIGRGFHHQAGEPHAEIMAIRDATARNSESGGGTSGGSGASAVAGSTCYTTLEPCHHQGRTGPCDQALIDAKVGRVRRSFLKRILHSRLLLDHPTPARLK